MGILETLAAEVDEFQRVAAMPPSSFGRAACGDWRFIKRLRRGDDFRISTVERVRAFIAANWPADAETPCPVAANGGAARVVDDQPEPHGETLPLAENG